MQDRAHPRVHTYVDNMSNPPVLLLSVQLVCGEKVLHDRPIDPPQELLGFALVHRGNVLIPPNTHQPHNVCCLHMPRNLGDPRTCTSWHMHSLRSLLLALEGPLCCTLGPRPCPSQCHDNSHAREVSARADACPNLPPSATLPCCYLIITQDVNIQIICRHRLGLNHDKHHKHDTCIGAV